jgi:hypothetical protein
MKVKIDKRFSNAFGAWRYFIWVDDWCVNNVATEEFARERVKDIIDGGDTTKITTIFEKEILDDKKEQGAMEMKQELKEQREKSGVSSDTARTNPELLEQISKDGDATV